MTFLANDKETEMLYTEKDIEYLTASIVETVNPSKVILFGSYAYGTPEKHSDIDLIVVTPSAVPREKRSRYLIDILEHFSTKSNEKILRKDILFLSDEETRLLKDDASSVVYDAFRRGRVLYDQ